MMTGTKEICPVCGRVATFYPKGSYHHAIASFDAYYFGHFRAHQADKGVRCPGGGNSVVAQHCAADAAIKAMCIAIAAFAARMSA